LYLRVVEVVVEDFLDKEEALKIVEESVALYQKMFGKK